MYMCRVWWLLSFFQQNGSAGLVYGLSAVLWVWSSGSALTAASPWMAATADASPPAYMAASPWMAATADALPPARFGTAMADDIDAGSAAFCATCSKLFRHFSAADDDPRTGKPRCEDCAALARMKDAVEQAFLNDERRHKQDEPRRKHGTLKHLLATPDAILGTLSLAAASASGASSTHEGEAGGVVALQQIIVSMRRENRELRRKLFGSAAAAAAAEEANGREAASASAPPSSRERVDDPVATLSLTLDALIPRELRVTNRYRALDDRLSELAVTWKEKERQLVARRAAQLAAEATVVTLQEELLMLETSQVTLGNVVRSQQGELSHGRHQRLTQLPCMHACVPTCMRACMLYA